MTTRYYQEELVRLRELAAEFSRGHPALAPMLSGPSQDPDVERLLEGAAFLSGLLRHKLDDELPEVIHGLMQLVFPHYLRPVPAASIVAFTPQPGLMDNLAIPRGTELASVPVEGTSCIFRTCFPVELQPLRLLDAGLQAQPGSFARLALRFGTNGIPLNQWHPGPLRLHLAGDYSDAASRWALLQRNVTRILVSTPGARQGLELHPGALQPVGLDRDQGLFPYPQHTFPGYRLLQEYFVLPEKFLFLDLHGLERWQERGTGQEFTLAFELERLPDRLPTVKREHFVLFATPVVNLFAHEADPILLDQRQTEYRVFPAGAESGHFQVYSVEGVIGIQPGTARRREFAPFELFVAKNSTVPLYTVRQRLALKGNGTDCLLSVAYPPEAGLPEAETLSLQLLCTNGNLPEALHYGDISQPTSTSPSLCSFQNIRLPSPPVAPPLEGDLLWRLLSHLSLNLLSVANTENLKTLLRLYVFPMGRDHAAITANELRIAGIVNLENQLASRLVGGIPMRGTEIRLEIDLSRFGSYGDMFLFGSVLDMFLGMYANLNSFTQLRVKEKATGKVTEWPSRLGDRPLI